VADVLLDAEQMRLLHGCWLDVTSWDSQCPRRWTTVLEQPQPYSYGGAGLDDADDLFSGAAYAASPALACSLSGLLNTTRNPQSPSNMTKLMAFVNAYYRADFNVILVTHHIDPWDDYRLPHLDDTDYLDPIAGKVTISYGGPRTMFFIAKNTGKKVSWPLLSSHMISMRGAYHANFEHGTATQKTHMLNRVSFTFEKHLPSYLGG
jgi:hypothetical protein